MITLKSIYRPRVGWGSERLARRQHHKASLLKSLIPAQGTLETNNTFVYSSSWWPLFSAVAGARHDKDFFGFRHAPTSDVEKATIGSSLSPCQTSQDIMAVCARLNREQTITILLVTCEPDIARLARHLIRFRDGHIRHDRAVAP